MDKIQKFLRRLNPKERTTLADVIARVHTGKLAGLDVKKMKGRPGLFRVRVGAVRVIFQREKKATRVIFVGRRTEGIYKL